MKTELFNFLPKNRGFKISGLLAFDIENKSNKKDHNCNIVIGIGQRF